MENATASPVFVGIDVAKNRLDLHLLPSGKAMALAHDEAGLAQVTAFLAGLSPALIVPRGHRRLRGAAGGRPRHRRHGGRGREPAPGP
ncbi:hypothetical protein ACFQX4_22890 [Roseomonas sp. GCM10028921]